MVPPSRLALFLLLFLAPVVRADIDGDGVEDGVDNCIYVANLNQADAGGLSSLAPDGIGDACQCGDSSGNGLPDIADVVRLARVLDALLPPLLAPARCDVEPTASCAATDLARLRQALAGLPPGIEPVCAAARPQAVCGNAIAETGERCDSEDLRGATCQSLGHASGTLACRPSCAFDASSCFPSLLAIAVGDSLVHDFAPGDAASPGQGWMHELPLHFATGGLVWEDHARNGSSTKSFRDLGYWTTALAAGPRWVLIQFGHNDDNNDPVVHTDPDTTYRANLHAMVIEVRAIGAEPIFVTLPPYFYAAEDGFHVRRPNGLEDYVAAMHAQAAADGVPVVELHVPLMDVYDLLGIPLARTLYSFENSPGVPNIVHFSVGGAKMAAETILSQLSSASPSLAAYLLTAP